MEIMAIALTRKVNPKLATWQLSLVFLTILYFKKSPTLMIANLAIASQQQQLQNQLDTAIHSK
jgi:hypothetical protein